MGLSEKDIEDIKYEKRMGYIFALFILLGGGLFNSYYFLTDQEKDITLICLIDIGIVLLSLLTCYLMNRKNNADLLNGGTITKTEKIQYKESETSWEAGSGAMYIPGLGDLFPKLWGQEMRPSQKYYLIINMIRYEIDEDLYKKVNDGDWVDLRYTESSGVLLGIEKTSKIRPDTDTQIGN